jgi:hypothetical protein
MKTFYVLQPYQVGSKRSKSLALVIPAKVVRECNIDTSTVFALRTNVDTKHITLQQAPYPTDHNVNSQERNKPAGQSFQATNQLAGRVP